MGLLRSVVESIETQLQAMNYSRSSLNFTLENVPTSIAHKSYTFGEFSGIAQYHSGNRADYLDTILPLLVLWKVRGTHNASGTYQEGYLDALDAIEEIETELVKNQPQANSENNRIENFSITPLFGDDEQEYLLLTIEIIFDAIRDM